MQINLSEFIINELLKNNIDTAFIVAGGGSMFLVDAIGKSRMKKYYLHHEQSCSMAAEGYAKVLNNKHISNCLSSWTYGGDEGSPDLYDTNNWNLPLVSKLTHSKKNKKENV